MILSDIYPKKDHSFYDLKNEESIVKISWSKDYEKDYSYLADNYLKCGYELCKEIVSSNTNRVKSDMWFLPSVYILRQSIELALKALICKISDRNKQIQEVFQDCKHNLYKLFQICMKSNDNNLDESELAWLDNYLSNLENIDEKSDLFRFPFNNAFLSQYEDKFLDIPEMVNNLLQCYLLINKCLNKNNQSKTFKIDLDRDYGFLQFANSGIGNCHLWVLQDFYDSDKKIIGYSEAANYLLFECKDIPNEEKSYPIIFLLRNSIELSLKRLFYLNISNDIYKILPENKRKSHLIYKDLWWNLKPIIEHFNNTNTNLLSVIDNQLKELSRIDKKGDTFRYPTSYDLEYKFNNIEIDLKNIYIFLQLLINFLDGCYLQLSEI